MKHKSPVLLAALTLLAIASPANAIAAGLNELSVSVGIRSNYRMQPLQDGFNTWQNQSGEAYNRENIKDAGAYFLSFLRPMTPKFSLGITTGIEQESGTFSDEGAQHSGTYRKRNLTVAMEARYCYYEREKLRMYASAGLGFHAFMQATEFRVIQNGFTYAIESNEQLGGGPAYHINAFGARYGGKAGVFLEAGYGYKGMLNGGLSVRF